MATPFQTAVDDLHREQARRQSERQIEDVACEACESCRGDLHVLWDYRVRLCTTHVNDLLAHLRTTQEYEAHAHAQDELGYIQALSVVPYTDLARRSWFEFCAEVRDQQAGLRIRIVEWLQSYREACDASKTKGGR